LATACVRVFAALAVFVMRMLPLLLVLLLAGCTRGGEDQPWPTLAPRAGEASPLVPRTPLGACPGCGQDMIAAPVVVAAPPLPPVGADVAGRIDAVGTAIAEVEAAYPAQLRTTQAAVRLAAAGGADAVGEAEVQRSRLESLFLPLAVQGRALDAIEDDLAGKAGAEVPRARVEALRARLAALQAVREGV
jgi:hypothetical protein